MNPRSSNPITAVQALLQHLEAENVEYVFGIPGGPLMPLYEALFERGSIQPILTKHEQGAAFMADGYARVRRSLGVCCATTGPGGTNALTGIACAAADSIPVLLLTAQVATTHFGKGAAQESTSYGIDLVNLYRTATKASLMLINAETVADTARYCLRQALSGRPGPVHLNFPADLMKRKIHPKIHPPEHYRASSHAFDRASIKEAARRLIHSRRPAILLGHGAALSNAFEEVRRLAERLVIPVATTAKAKGAFPEDHLLSLGVFGFAGCPQAEAYFLSGETDVLLTIGTSLGEQSTNAWDPRLMPQGCLIQVDADPHEIGKNYPSHIPVIGDAKAVLTELLFELERELRWRETSTPPRNESWIRNLKSRHPRYLREGLMEDEAIPLQPPRVMRELREALPHDAIVFSDIGNCMAWAIHYLPIYEPGTFHINLGLASMGHAVAAAIGGQLAAPEKAVVSIVGDAGFAMNGMEVHTAVEYDIPVIWIVLNNGGHGMVHFGEQLQFKGKFSSAKFRRPIDIASLATSLGARAFKVEKPGETRAAVEAALKQRRPTVIDARVDIETKPPMDARIETLDRFFMHGPTSADIQQIISAA